MTNDETLLINCFSLIGRLVENRGGKSHKFKKIKNNVQQLYFRYGICRDEIVSILILLFQRRNRHLKYNPELASLETFVTCFVNYELLTLVEKYREKYHEVKTRTIPLSDLENGEKIKDRIGCSLSPYERQGIDALIDSNSPEDELLKKELAQIASEFFGYDDLAVLLGAKDRQAEAERLGVDYFTYCKRLQRKVQQFKSHLKNIKYLQ